MKRVFLALPLVAAFLLAGCQTPADRWLAQNLSARDKAELMADRGQEAFDKMVEEDTLTAAPQVKDLLQLALKTDPGLTRAAELLQKVDEFLAKRQSETQGRVKVLTAKPALSDKEKFTLVVLVRKLEVLAAPGIDLSALQKQTKAIQAEVAAKGLQTLASAEKALASAKTPADFGKAAAAVAGAIANLREIDPKGSSAGPATQRLAAALALRIRTDVEAASKALKALDYPQADQILSRLDQTLAGAGVEFSVEVDELRYRTAFEWARTLSEAKRYPEAGTRINDALQIRNTPEAQDLRDRIVRAASARDWDAEYEATDRQIDALVKAGDLKTAWSLSGTAAARLKKDETKARVAQRRKQIQEAAWALYETAVTAYNEEDYADAKARFDKVAAVDPAYKLTKAYQDKARAKLQVLEAR